MSLFIFDGQTQNNNSNQVTRLPVFDVHVHVSKVRPGSTALCPCFLTSMPGSDPNEQGISFLNSDCLDPLMPAKDDADMKNEIVKRINEMNLTMIAFGDPGVMRSWMKEVPERKNNSWNRNWKPYGRTVS